MKMPPLVSIVISNYNYGRFLAEAIDSALNQTYPNVEVIVVDDGSTDNSREIIAGYDERVIPVLKANGGQASAFNVGFRASHGDLVFFLDSDDVLNPAAVDTAVREWREGLARMCFPLRVIDAKGEPSGDLMGTAPPLDPLLGPFYGGSPTSGNVFSHAALTKLMPVPEEYWRMCTDVYVNSASMLFGETWHLNQPLGQYRVHGTNNFACADHSTVYRMRIDLDLRLYRELFRLTRGKIAPIEKWLGANPHHWMRRIRSLREQPQNHPWPDSFLGLTTRAVIAAWREPRRNFRQRLTQTFYSAGYGLLPGKAIRDLKKILKRSAGNEQGQPRGVSSEQKTIGT